VVWKPGTPNKVGYTEFRDTEHERLYGYGDRQASDEMKRGVTE
jgi:hypothetical protein